MEYTILVSVDEFLENGGALKKGRIIYSRSSSILGYFEPKKSFSAQIAYTSVVTKSISASSSKDVFVRIEVSPIYK